MDNLITKPLKRLFSNSTLYAKKQISDYYNIKSIQYSANCDAALFNMTEMQTIINTNNATLDYNENHFDDSINNKILNTVNDTELNSPNKIKVYTTKIVEQPVKNIVKYINNNSNVSNPENIQIINELEQQTSQQVKKTVPVIKIKVKFINNNNKDNTNRNKIDADNIESENQIEFNNIECDATNYTEVEKIDENTQTEKQDNQIDENTQTIDDIITVEDKTNEESDRTEDFKLKDAQTTEPKLNNSSPLSPVHSIASPKERFRPIGELINFHEQQVHGKPFQNSKTLPRMGTSALYTIRSPEKKSSLTDPEIISAMVHDRFIVNLYESRSYRRNFKAKPSTYGRIFRSLDRDTSIIPNFDNTYNKEFKNDIICMKQSSPIKLSDQHFSLSPKNTSNILSFNYDEIQEVNATEEEILDEDKFIEHLTLHEEKSSSSAILFQEDEHKEETKANSEHFEESDAVYEETDVYPNSNDSKVSEMIENNDNTKSPKPLEETEPSSYNMEEFLKKALGEELTKYESHLDSTIEIDTKETRVKEKITSPEIKQILHEESMCTSDASDLISKINTLQSNFYRSLTKKIQHMSDTLKIPSAPKREEETKICDTLENLFPNNDIVNDLVRQAAVQYESMKQITKALTVCRNTKEFSVSPEQVEGERLLLIASYKRQVILDEIRRLDYEIDETSSSAERGTVLISGVTLPLKEDSAEQMATSRKDYNRWYVCIFSCGPRVFATQPTLANTKGNVYFSEEVIFTELPSDFTINVEVHCLLQRRPNRNFSHESKFHINKETKTTHCPSPKKFLQREKTKNKIPTRFDTGIRASSFKLCGSLKLRVADLCKSGEWYMRKVPLCSILNGSIHMNLQSIIKIPIKFSGFLTVGSEAGSGSAVWNRRWCVLDGHKLRYWNYPCEEDTSKPLREIDLKYCINALIETANREICARPRTLLIETALPPKSNDTNSLTVLCKNKSYTIERNFLSADCFSDLQSWELNLNIVVRAIRTWNAGYLK